MEKRGRDRIGKGSALVFGCDDDCKRTGQKDKNKDRTGYRGHMSGGPSFGDRAKRQSKLPAHMQ